MSKVSKLQIKKAFDNYCKCCQQALENIRTLTDKQIQTMFKIETICNQSSFYEPRSLSTVNKNDLAGEHQNSKFEKSSKLQLLEKTVKKNDKPQNKKYKQNNSTKLKISPFWSRVNNHMSKIQVNSSELALQHTENPQKIEKQFEDFMIELKNMKIRAEVKQSVDGNKEQNEQMETWDLKTAKKSSNQASQNISSLFLPITKFETGRQILNAPKKQKKYSRICKISAEQEKDQQKQEVLYSKVNFNEANTEKGNIDILN